MTAPAAWPGGGCWWSRPRSRSTLAGECGPTPAVIAKLPGPRCNGHDKKRLGVSVNYAELDASAVAEIRIDDRPIITVGQAIDIGVIDVDKPSFVCRLVSCSGQGINLCRCCHPPGTRVGGKDRIEARAQVGVIAAIADDQVTGRMRSRPDLSIFGVGMLWRSRRTHRPLRGRRCLKRGRRFESCADSL